MFQSHLDVTIDRLIAVRPILRTLHLYSHMTGHVIQRIRSCNDHVIKINDTAYGTNNQSCDGHVTTLNKGYEHTPFPVPLGLSA